MRKVVVFLIVTFVVSSGMATYLYLDCRNLEAELAASSEAAVAAPAALAVSAVAPTISAEAQLEELRAELTEAETARAALEQEVAELEEANRAMEEENTLTMAELAEVAPEAYEDFAAELKEYYLTYQAGVHVEDERKMLNLLEETGLLKMDSADRRNCEEYFAAWREYVDGVLDNRWTDEECQERYRQLGKLYHEEGYLADLHTAIYDQGLCVAYGVATWEEAEREMSKSMVMATALTMTEVWQYGSVLSKRHAREMLAQDCPPLDYGLAPGEEDEAVRELEESFAYRREVR